MQVYTSPAGLCEGQSFAARGCAGNQADHQLQLDEIGQAIDEYLTEDTCRKMLWNGTDDIFKNVFYSNGHAGEDVVPESANVTGLCNIILGEPKGTGKLDSLTSSPKCENLCRFRSLFVHQMLGTCGETPDCPAGFNNTQMLCCYLLATTVDELCEDYKVQKVSIFPRQSSAKVNPFHARLLPPRDDRRRTLRGLQSHHGASLNLSLSVS